MTDELIVQRVPFLMNLGQPETVIGWTDIYKMPDGNAKMVTKLSPHGTELVENFAEIADIKGIGFAGVMRRSDG